MEREEEQTNIHFTVLNEQVRGGILSKSQLQDESKRVKEKREEGKTKRGQAIDEGLDGRQGQMGLDRMPDEDRQEPAPIDESIAVAVKEEIQPIAILMTLDSATQTPDPSESQRKYNQTRNSPSTPEKFFTIKRYPPNAVARFDARDGTLTSRLASPSAVRRPLQVPPALFFVGVVPAGVGVIGVVANDDERPFAMT
ncbi:hypothetical protein B0H14DRAFT_2658408 [Mycena olivaceomarginata]|nr:hypothetical protein B0H14DRAFT_2658408 [Mycena olivaceomarginata]